MSTVRTLTINNEDYDLKEVQIEPKLSTYQEIVGGYIDCFRITDKLGFYVNDEGKLIDLDPSFLLVSDKKIVEIASGNAVFTKIDGKGDSISLTDEDIDLIKESFSHYTSSIPVMDLDTFRKL